MDNELPDHEVDAARGELNVFLRSRPDLSPIDLVPHTTLSDCTLRSFAGGHIRGGRRVVSEVRRVLDLARLGEILQPSGGGPQAITIRESHAARVLRVAKRRDTYQIETLKRVAQMLDYCAEQCAIGVITADFGVGKTESVEVWRRGHRDVPSAVFEFDEFTRSNKIEFIRLLAEEIGIQPAIGSNNGAKVFRSVVEKLREEPRLLIFDQCEAAQVRVFQIIRQIWDRTHEYGVGIVLLSAPVLLARMHGSRMSDLGALTSRVGAWAQLVGVSKAEMATIVRQEGVKDMDEAAFDLWWKATGGSMRRLLAALDMLKAKHLPKGKPVTEETIAGIAGYLWGMKMAG